MRNCSEISFGLFSVWCYFEIRAVLQQSLTLPGRHIKHENMIFTLTFDVQSGGLGYDDDKRDCCHSIVFIVAPFDNSAGGAQNLCRSRHICSTKWRNSI